MHTFGLGKKVRRRESLLLGLLLGFGMAAFTEGSAERSTLQRPLRSVLAEPLLQE
jgi:hypothetical protein